MPMIDKDRLIEDLPHWQSADGSIRKEALMAMINTQPVKEGKLFLFDVQDHESYQCSYCGHVYEEEYNEDCDKWNYCPICGCCFIDWEEFLE